MKRVITLILLLIGLKLSAQQTSWGFAPTGSSSLTPTWRWITGDSAHVQIFQGISSTNYQRIPTWAEMRNAIGGGGGAGTTTFPLSLTYGFIGQPLSFNGSSAITGKIDSLVITSRALLTTYLTKAQIVAGYAPINSTLYKGDGTLTGNRTVSLATNTLLFSNNTGTSIEIEPGEIDLYANSNEDGYLQLYQHTFDILGARHNGSNFSEIFGDSTRLSIQHQYSSGSKIKSILLDSTANSGIKVKDDDKIGFIYFAHPNYTGAGTSPQQIPDRAYVDSVAAGGGGSFINNGTSLQASSNFYISGTGKATTFTVGSSSFSDGNLFETGTTGSGNLNGNVLTLQDSFGNPFSVQSDLSADGGYEMDNVEIIQPFGGKLSILGYLDATIPSYSSGTANSLVYNSTNSRIESRTGTPGTVTTLSVVSTNGFAGTVANPTTTPAITISTTITGLLKGNGTAINAATAGTDYLSPTGTENVSNKTFRPANTFQTGAGTAGTDSLVVKTSGALKAIAANYYATSSGYVPYTGATTDLSMGVHNISAQNISEEGTAGNGYNDLISQSASPASASGHIRLYSDSLNRLAWKNSTYRRTIQVPYPSDYTIRMPYLVTGTTLEDSSYSRSTYVPLTRTINGAALSSNVTITTANTDTTSTGFRTAANSRTLAQTQTALNLKANLISPSFTTPSLGAATITSLNGLIITPTAGTLTIPNNASAVLQQTGNFNLNLTVTAATTATFPTGTGTLPYIGAANTWALQQTLSGGLGTAGISSANFFAIGGSLPSSAQNAAGFQFGGSTNVDLRAASMGTTSGTLGNGDSYAAFIVGKTPFTTASASVTKWGASAVFNSLGTVTLGASGASLTNSSTVFINGAITTATNNYVMVSYDNQAAGTNNAWFKYGITEVSALKTDSLLTGTVGTDAIIVNHSGILGSIAASNLALTLPIVGTPTIVAGTGAGTSPTVSVTSNGKQLQVTVTTGTLPTGTNATIATVTLANALTYTPYPVFSSASAATALLNGASMIYMTSTGTANVTITSGTTALTAATTYVWNVSL